MKFLSPQSASSVISIIIHACLLIILLLYVRQETSFSKKEYVEVGFGGIEETNSPGMPGSGPASVYNPPAKEKIPEKKKPKEVVKEKIPGKTEKKSSDKIDSSKANVTSGKNATGTNSSGGNVGSSGTGTGGNGQNGSAPPKKGVNVDNDVYLVAVDQMPYPLGGMESINSKAYYPPPAKAANIQGTVYVQAFIDERGFVRRTILIKGIGAGCDQSAMRAVKETKFEAGRLHGVPVKVQMTVAVSFRIKN